MTTRKQFHKILSKLVQPLREPKQTKVSPSDGGYTSKKTHQRKPINALEKLHGKSR